jgi:hypothetical protein
MSVDALNNAMSAASYESAIPCHGRSGSIHANHGHLTLWSTLYALMYVFLQTRTYPMCVVFMSTVATYVCEVMLCQTLSNIFYTLYYWGTCVCPLFSLDMHSTVVYCFLRHCKL